MMDAVGSRHPNAQALSDYGLGKLDPEASGAIDEHLEGCDDCRSRVAGASSDSFLGRLREANRPSAGSIAGGSPADGTMVVFRPGRTSSPPAAGSLPPGLAEHPDYRIKKELGRGGMGVVYLAHNTMMGRDEVLKVIGRGIMERPDVFERFQREIRAVARLRHPNIVAAYSAFRIEGGLVFAMEHVEGLDLSRLVKAKGPLPVVQASYFLHQAALGLQHAHDRGMIHRDIKPHNLMLTHDGKARIVKVLDFGLAKATREERVDGGLTTEGQALGTPDYVAPEQILNAVDADIRADIYSLGGTLYYLLAGRPPFRANSLYDIYQAHISREIEPLNLIRPEIPAELAGVVSKMMAKDPDRRLQTPGEVAEALKPFFKGRAPGPRPGISRAGASIVEAPAPSLAEPFPPAATEEHDLSGSEAIAPIESGVPQPASPADPPGRRPARLGKAIAAGVLGLGIVALLAGIVRVRTARGDLVFDDLPDRAVVTVDGEAATIDWSGGKESARVSVAPGGHKVRVFWKGAEILGEEVTVASGESRPIRVRLEPGDGKVETPSDLLQVGSVWAPEGSDAVMTIVERAGDRFEAIYVSDDLVREFHGTIKGNRIAWLALDGKVIAGGPASDHDGEISGDRIAITRYEADGSVAGRAEVRLKRPAPSASEKAADAFQAGSVWVHEDAADGVFTVLDRVGETFRALNVNSTIVRDIRGTIRGDHFSYTAEDIRCISGPPASTAVRGEVRGEEFSTTWIGKDGSQVAGRPLRLKKPGP